MLKRRAGARELGVNLDALAQYLGGTITTGDTITFPGPGHSSIDRSASVTFTNEAWNGIFKSHSYSSKDEVKQIEETVFEALDDIGWTGESLGEEYRLSGEDKRAQGVARALRAWGFGRDAPGTPVQLYIEGRDLRLPPGDEIRYHQFGQFGRVITPMMLAAVRSIATNEIVAIHRTALTMDGRKNFITMSGEPACRAFLGSQKGGAIKLFPLGPRLGIGEGIETSLSLRESPATKDLPVWSLMSSTALASFPVLEGVEELLVAEDNDGAGLAVVSEVATRWRKAGRRVQVIGPRGVPGYDDLNDVNDMVRRMKHGKEKRGRGLD